MHDFSFFQDLVIVFGFALVVVLIFSRLGISSLIGLLFTGVLLGPSGLHLIKDVETGEALSEAKVTRCFAYLMIFQILSMESRKCWVIQTWAFTQFPEVAVLQERLSLIQISGKKQEP
jgi:predicted Kef-type K+ transport protein